LCAQLMSAIFGSQTQQSAVANLVGETAGLKPNSGPALMGMAAPLVLGILGKQAASDGGLTTSSLATLLSAELPGLRKFMPSSIGTLITGLGSGAAKMPSVAAGEAASSGGGGWVLPALVGLVLLGLLTWWFLKGSAPAPETAKAPEVAATPNPWAALGEMVKRKLADGTELSIPRLGVENRLIDFIEDSSKPVDKTTWFDFDRLLFDTGKATLQPASQEQLSNVAAILKAYPKVKMRIGGYTDNVGDKAANVTLSQDRSTNVMAELVKLGTDQSRLDSKGYGEENPVASNDNEEGRAKNRRISIRVTEK
jgi:OOP family OmpA-OmpF porin